MEKLNLNNVLSLWLSILFYDEMGNLKNDNLSNITYSSGGKAVLELKDGRKIKITLEEI